MHGFLGFKHACRETKPPFGTSIAHPRARRSTRREMATSTPTVPAVGGAKLASLDVTPAGPLDAARALSPATGATITPSDEPSPRKRFWEARASAWTGAEGDAAFGSVAPSAKTAAGAEDTARGAGMLSRRVADDRETPRVAGVEPESGTEVSTERAATTATAAGDAAAFLGDAAEEDKRSALRATARALDFDPNARHTSGNHAKLGKWREREAARGALLAFLARKAETLFLRRSARAAFKAWRGAAAAVVSTHEVSSQNITGNRTARLALRAWRLVAHADRARAESDLLRGRLAEALAARAVAEARGTLSLLGGEEASASLSDSLSCVEAGRTRLTEKTDGRGEDAEPPPLRFCDENESARPPYGVLDEKLALWLGVEPRAPSRRVGLSDSAIRTSFADDDEDDVESRVARRASSSTTDGFAHTREDRKHARGRLDAMEALMEATREAEARARALETRAQSLETDLYAAAVVWEETERENRLLTERVAAMREDAERMKAALAVAEVEAAEAARAAAAARRDAAREREAARERRRMFAVDETSDAYARGDHGYSRGSSYAPRRSFVGEEVEELEACAAAMRRSMRRPA
jgi:hypothetical protein